MQTAQRKQSGIGKRGKSWQVQVMTPTTRRDFLKTAAVAAAGLSMAPALAAEAPAKGIKLGLDNFAVRGLNWKAPELIDYAAKLKTDSLFISDLKALGSLEDENLKNIRKMAADKGLQIHLGTWSICPTSKRFEKTWGTAEEHLATGIRCAKALGSPVLRVILGADVDRQSEGGIEARIADTVKVLQSQKSKAVDSGVKIAVENHAGDMQSWELVTLIEAAGKDFVGANMDSGNAVWTCEAPMASLEILGPYAITTSLRESAVWETEKGAMTRWVAMGDGDTDWPAYIKRFAELCPGIPVHVETISGASRELKYLEPEFWKAYPKGRAKDLAQFVAWVKKGKPRGQMQRPAGEKEFQLEQIERSITYLRGLGLGPQT